SALLLAGAMIFTVPNAATVQALAAKAARITVSSVKETGNAAVTISWKKVSSVRKYKVLRSTKKNGNGAKTLAIVTKTKYVDNSTDDGKTYYYSVKSASGAEALSSWKKFKTSSAPVLGKLRSDTTGLIAGTSDKVIFTIDVKNYKRVGKNAIKLYQSSKSYGTFRDDGKGDDAVKGDGTYTCSKTLSAGTAGTSLIYVAKLGSKSSDELSIDVYSNSVSTDSADNFKTVINGFGEINDKYADKNGYVKESDLSTVIDEAYKAATEWKNQGILDTVEKHTGSVYVTFVGSGLRYTFSPMVAGTKAGAGSTQLTTMIFKPFYGMDISADDYNFNNTVADNAISYVEALSNVTKGDVVTRHNVDETSVKKISDHQIIYWDGHGGYSDDLGPEVCSGKEWSNGDLINYMYDLDTSDPIYKGIVSGEYNLVGPANGENRIAYTGKFFEDKLTADSLDDTIIYFSICDGGVDDRLASAFTKKGATVIAFTDSVSSYSDDLGGEIFKNLATVNKSSGKYYTAGEALSKAESDIGASEDEYDQRIYGYSLSDSYNARPVIFGNTDFRVSDETVTTQTGDNNTSSTGQETIDVPGNDTTSSVVSDTEVSKAFTSLKNQIEKSGITASDGKKTLYLPYPYSSSSYNYVISTAINNDGSIDFDWMDITSSYTQKMQFKLTGGKNSTIRPTITYELSSSSLQDINGVAVKDYPISGLTGTNGEIEFDITPVSTYDSLNRSRQSLAYSIFALAETEINIALKKNCQMSLGDLGFGNFPTYGTFDDSNSSSNNTNTDINTNQTGNDGTGTNTSQTGNIGTGTNTSQTGTDTSTTTGTSLEKLKAYVNEHGVDNLVDGDGKVIYPDYPYSGGSRYTTRVAVRANGTVEITWTEDETYSNQGAKVKFALDGTGKFKPEVERIDSSRYSNIGFKAVADRYYDISTLSSKDDISYIVTEGYDGGQEGSRVIFGLGYSIINSSLKNRTGLSLKDLGFTNYK
ncbi:MAG: hypothetical protein ACI4CS_01700, partial [Candidatus Weimeria sp.]